MTEMFLVKYGPNDFRLIHWDGSTKTEIDTYGSDPRQIDPDDRGNSPGSAPGHIKKFRNSLASHHGGGAALTNNRKARGQDTDILMGNWVFRDVDEHGDSEVPFTP